MILKILFIAGALSTNLPAAQESLFGLGGVSSGRVGAVTAEPDNPFAAIYNPALIPVQKYPQLGLSAGGGSVSYEPFTDIRVDSYTSRTIDGREAPSENYQLADYSSFQWALGFAYPFRLPDYLANRKSGLGIVLNGPFNRLRGYVSNTPYDFTPLRYGANDSQFQALVGTGFEIIPNHLFVGAGVSLYITISGAADATVITENPTGRMALDVGLNSTFIGGLFGSWGNSSASFVYRQAKNPEFVLEVSGRAQLADGAETFDIPMLLKTSLYFEPESYELEYQHDFKLLKVSLGLAYQRWSAYEPSFVVLETQTREGETPSTRVPDIPFDDTWNPRLSVSVPIWKQLSLSSGYQFRPSPVTDSALSGEANLLDSDAHIFGLSLSNRFDANAILPFPIQLALHGQWHRLVDRKIQKNSQDAIGAPGYDFEAEGFFYGLSVTAEL